MSAPRFNITDPALQQFMRQRQRAEAFLAVLDPAWKSDSGGGGKGANAQYALESGRNMAGQIRTSGVWPMEGDTLAWVWATTLSIVSGETHEFIARLGLRPCATFVWVKTEGEADDDHFRLRRVPGIGQWQRCDHEFLILCRRGSVDLPDVKSRSVILAPIGAHSEKPDDGWRLIDSVSRQALRSKLSVDAVEFFCRSPRPGWGAYGTLAGPNTPVVFEPAAQEWC